MRLLYYIAATSVRVVFADTIPPPPRLLDRPLRIVVADVEASSTTSCIVFGRIEAGRVALRDKVVLVPGSAVGDVKKVLRESVPRPLATAGDYVLLSITGSGLEHIRCANVLCCSSAVDFVC